MLGVVRRLPEAEGLPRSLERISELATAWPGELLELRLQLEVEPGCPHLSFVARLLDLVRRVAETDGVAFTPALLRSAERLARHARCVAEAWQQVNAQAGQS